MPIFDSTDLADMRDAVDALKVPEPRTILVHLNITVPTTDIRGANAIARSICDTLEAPDDTYMRAVCVLSEEI